MEGDAVNSIFAEQACVTTANARLQPLFFTLLGRPSVTMPIQAKCHLSQEDFLPLAGTGPEMSASPTCLHLLLHLAPCYSCWAHCVDLDICVASDRNLTQTNLI